MAKSKKRRGKRTALDGTNWGSVLAEPISLDREIISGRTSLLPDNEAEAASEQAFQERLFAARWAKMEALFQFFGIAPNSRGCWQGLAFCLAATCVPGFQVAGKGGAPKTGPIAFDVCYQIHSYLQQRPSATITMACNALAKPGKPLAHLTPSRARRIYSENQVWRKILQNASQWDAHQAASTSQKPAQKKVERKPGGP